MKFLDKKIKILTAVSFMILLVSCDSYLGDGTNVDPNRVFEDDVSLSALLPPVLVSTANAHFNVAFTTSQYSQHTSFVGDTDNQEEAQLAGAWSNIYLGSLNNLAVMEKKAIEQDAFNYLGIIKILQAVNLGLATNSWEDIPWTEAFVDGEFTPAYDSQESMYNVIQTLLDEAIVELQKPAGEFNQPGSDDLAFGGDIARWIRTAYALKARYHIHLINKGAADASANALSAVSSAQQNNEDDLQISFTERNLNPWHTDAFLARQTGNPAPVLSDQIVSSMNGTTYPEFDPRLPIIADNGGEDEFFGSVNGSFGTNFDSPNNLSNTVFTGETWHSQADAPIPMITYSEVNFIESEAAFLRDNGGNRFSVGASQQSYDAYLNGIRANMDKLGVSESEKEAYLTNPNVDVGAGNLTMELIMKEKYKALFLNPETFNDLRRYFFDETIFRDLDLPDNHNPRLNGEWIQRAVYPSSEFSRNEEEVRKVVKDIDTQMWFYN